MDMPVSAWVKELPAAVTVCDLEGMIIGMNDVSAKTFERYGGLELVGKNLMDCHPEPARSKLAAMLESGGQNAYTIEKNGVKKIIHQLPWHENGELRGLVEISVEIPREMAHFVRK